MTDRSRARRTSASPQTANPSRIRLDRDHVARRRPTAEGERAPADAAWTEQGDYPTPAAGIRQTR